MYKRYSLLQRVTLEVYVTSACMTLWLAAFSYTVLTVHWEWQIACHNKQTCGHLTFSFPFSVVHTVRVSVLLVGDSELTLLLQSSLVPLTVVALWPVYSSHVHA